MKGWEITHEQCVVVIFLQPGAEARDKVGIKSPAVPASEVTSVLC